MAFKQPRVPEYRESDGTGKYIRSLVLFLKDFCMDVWTANNQRRTWPEQLMDIYPVGSIYMSVASTSPARLFGGTWEQLKDRFLLAAGSTYAAGSTGGEAAHILTVNEMPSHSHDLITSSGGVDQGVEKSSVTSFTWGSSYRSVGNNPLGTIGGNKPHNNMPPYLAVYMWKRVS